MQKCGEFRDSKEDKKSEAHPAKPEKAKPGAFWVVEGMRTVGNSKNQARKPGAECIPFPYNSCKKETGENPVFPPVFFLHVLYGNGVHFGSDTWFSHPFAPVPNRCHPLKHPKRTRLQLFSPEIGCVSLFLPSFDLQKFRAGFSQTSGLSSHSYRFILTLPFPDAMIRIPAFLS